MKPDMPMALIAYMVAIVIGLPSSQWYGVLWFPVCLFANLIHLFNCQCMCNDIVNFYRLGLGLFLN